jgi:hypothetical protein
VTRCWPAAFGAAAALALVATRAATPAEEAAAVKYITDLSRCTPQSALSDGPRQGHWQLIPYETMDDPNVKAGTMVGAASYTEAPDLTLPLSVSGWHAIYVGYWNPHHAYDGGTTVKVKLSDDPCFLRVSESEPGFAPFDSPEGKWEQDRYKCYSVLKEVFVKNADLTGRDLVLGKVNGPFGEKAYIAYVKLVPLTAEEVAALQAERSKPGPRPMEGSIDGVSFFWAKEYRTPEHLLELVEPFRYSDVGKIIWAVNYGEVTNYPSKVGALWSTDPANPIEQSTNSYIKGEKVAALSLGSFLARGIIPQKVVAPHLREMGLKFDLMFRLGIATHPQFRMALADGTLVEKASYAYPQVRAFMLALIEEATELFEPDGVNLCFVRGPEFVGYEKPVLDEFRERYGEDATTVGFDDPRMQAVRCSFMTRFVRDVRGVLDRVGRAQGRKVELSVWTYGSVEADLNYGFDILTWINEGLLDSVIAVGDPPMQAAAAEHGVRLVPAIWDIDPDDRARFSKEVRDRQQDVSVRLWTVGGVNIGYTDASRSALWEAAYSGG